jgi:transposase
MARQVLRLIAEQIEELDVKIVAIEPALGDHPGHGADHCHRPRSDVPDPSAFRSGRAFAAWLASCRARPLPAARPASAGSASAASTLSGVLLVNGARAVLLCSKAGRPIRGWHPLRTRKHRLVAAVALANRTARIAWAIMRKEDTYRHAAAVA